ncbi:MAG: hypothetical protein ACK5LO_04765 [Leucobacter sp.]
MNPELAEAILALAVELEQAAKLAEHIGVAGDAFDLGEADMLQLAAERIIE